MTDLVRDIRYGLRLLGKSKGFTTVAVLSLALGIGFNTTMFSAVDALLLRPKSVVEPETLVEVYLSDSSGYPYASSSYMDYREYRDRSDAFAGVVAQSNAIIHHTPEDGSSEFLLGEIVTGNFFETLGVRAQLGRTLEASDDVKPGAHPVVVVSDSFWRGRLGGDFRAIGRTIDLNGRPYVVVGVISPDYTGSLPGIGTQLWAPFAMGDHLNPDTRSGESWLERRTRRNAFVKARLSPGTTIEQAQARMDSLMAELREEYPSDYRDRAVHLLPSTDVRLHPIVDGALYPVAAVLMGVVGLVLVIACANVANMMLARASGRQTEVALRVALGSSRFRLIRLLLTESVLLAAIGGAIGIGIAYVSTEAILSLRPPIPLPIALDLTINGRVLLFTLGVSLVTGILFGLAPAWQAGRRSLVPALKSEQGLAGFGSRRLSLRNILVVAQVAVSLVLLIGASLLLRSAANARNIDPGFETERIVMFNSHLGLQGYDNETGPLFYERALERLGSLADVESVALTSKVPLGASVWTRSVAPEGREPERPGDWLEFDAADVSDGYFRTMGMSVVQGRDFSSNDRAESDSVAIVNRTAANRLWPNEDPLGRRLATGFEASRREYHTVVGVVEDSKVRTLGEEFRPQVYWSATQNYSPMVYVLARTRGPASATFEAARAELMALDPDLTFFEAKTMEQNLAIALFPVRMGAILLGLFGGLAVGLASVGLYGVIAFVVSRRTREIGLRMALGASSRDIAAMVTGQGLRLVLVGAALGILGAYASARALSAVLYGVRPNDMPTFAATTALLIAVGFIANWVPARRAARVAPTNALRYE
jgi:predicted permease